MSTFFKLYNLLKIYAPRRFGIYVVIISLACFFEAIFLPILYATLEKISVGSSNSSSDQLSSILLIFGIDLEQVSPLMFVYILLLVSVLVLILKSLSLALKSSIIHNLGFQISLDCFNRLFLQSYPHFIANSSASANVFFATYVENWAIANKNFLNLIRFFASFLLFSASLFIINYKISLALFSIIALMYTFCAITFFPSVQKSSKIVTSRKKEENELVSDMLRSIKEVIIYNSQSYFKIKYSNILSRLRISQARVVFLTNFPQIVIESAVSILIASLLLIALLSNFAVVNASILLFIFGFGLQRSLSGFQGLYTAFSLLNGFSSDVSYLYSFLQNDDYRIASIEKQSCLDSISIMKAEGQKALSFSNYIIFENVSFKYSSDSENVFSSISFNIPLRKVIGIVGISGSGKSTFVDLLSCALTPSTGSISINSDDKASSNNCSFDTISNLISVVSQEPILINGSVLENIVFGLTSSEIDWLRLQRCIEYSCLSSFIDKLPNGINHCCSDNGINFSGGEKQRIGLARALYSNPQILILDEATSALDVQTESSVINNIHQYFSELTIIMVAHKIHTLKRCDIVYELSPHGITEVDFDSLFGFK